MTEHSDKAPAQNTQDLNEIVQAALDLVTPQALFAKVRVETQLGGAMTVGSASREVTTLLVLQIFSQGILALCHRPAHRELTVRTFRAADGAPVLEVSDNGVLGSLQTRLDCLQWVFSADVGLVPGCQLSSVLKGDSSSIVTSFGKVVGDGRPTSQSGKQSAGSLDRPRILIVDDDAEVVNLLEGLLQKEDFVIDTATDGYQGLCKLRTGEYDVILLDMRMPTVDGSLFLRASSKESKDISDRVIVITGSLEPYRAILDQKKISYLPKPFSIDEVLELVRSKLRSRSRIP